MNGSLINKLQSQIPSSNNPSVAPVPAVLSIDAGAPTSSSIPETPKKTASVVPMTAATDSTPPKLTAKIHEAESGFTPSKIAIPPSPMIADEQEELEDEGSEKMVPKPSSRLEVSVSASNRTRRC